MTRRQITRPVQRTVKEARRVITSPLGTDPDFVIIGAQKCGTTSLYRYLSMHPQVGAARTKEVHYYSMHFDRGRRWYRSNFPHALRRGIERRVRGRRFVSGEASPDYMFDARAAERMRRDLPDVRLIALLRDPVTRALSHYRHTVRRGLEPLPFEEAIEAEGERLRNASPDSVPFRFQSYLARGRYAEQLERWFALFPREQILVLQAEDFFAETAAAYARVLSHIGVGPHDPGAFERHNFHGEYEGLSERAKRRLVDEFAPLNERLYSLIGERFDWPGAASPEAIVGEA
ncbi:MAG: sulfotransferase domain-containing protein [Planctomycetota bacterium]|nr:sulfotransferase domain-containing protein [Planctomycetota bacterium]